MKSRIFFGVKPLGPLFNLLPTPMHHKVIWLTQFAVQNLSLNILKKKNELKYRCHVCKCRTSTFTSFEKNSIHLFACGIFALFFEFNFYNGIFAKHIRMHTMYISFYIMNIYMIQLNSRKHLVWR